MRRDFPRSAETAQSLSIHKIYDGAGGIAEQNITTTNDDVIYINANM